MIKRTEGVSSTDIVGRMLLCSSEGRRGGRDKHRGSEEKIELAAHFSAGDLSDSDEDGTAEVAGAMSPLGASPASTSGVMRVQKTKLSTFLPTSRRIVQFSEGKTPQPGARVVYIDGAFDCFHHGHVEVLRMAREQGDFLLVGIHGDEEVRESHNKAPHLPIMNVYERTLSVLSCRYVDEAIMGAPRRLTEDLLKTFNISIVVHGTVAENQLHR